MDPQAGTSFIPKKTLSEGSRPRGSAFGLVLLVAILIFVASVVAAGAVFAYQGFLGASIASKSASLAKAQAAYEPGAIQDLLRLDTRMTQAKSVLQKHVAVSGIFSFLASQTLVTVQFTDFDYQFNTDGSATIELQGKANSFSTIALQSDQFGASKVLRDVIFSNIVIDDKGKLAFTVKATVDPSLILYSKNISGTSAVVPAITTSTDPAVASSTASTTSGVVNPSL